MPKTKPTVNAVLKNGGDISNRLNQTGLSKINDEGADTPLGNKTFNITESRKRDKLYDEILRKHLGKPNPHQAANNATANKKLVPNISRPGTSKTNTRTEIGTAATPTNRKPALTSSGTNISTSTAKRVNANTNYYENRINVRETIITYLKGCVCIKNERKIKNGKFVEILKQN